MLMLVLLSVAALAAASPFQCHCPNGQLGTQMSCPPAIQMPQACPPPPPCACPSMMQFPTLPPHNFGSQSGFPGPQPLPGAAAQGVANVQGVQPFSFPTLPPFDPSNPLGAMSAMLGGPAPAAQSQPPPPPPPPPPAPRPPFSDTETLVPIGTAPQQPALVSVDHTTTAAPIVRPSTITVAPPPSATMQNEQYVALENPEPATARPLPTITVHKAEPVHTIKDSVTEKSGEKLHVEKAAGTIYESEPNNGYRQPVRRDTNSTPSSTTEPKEEEKEEKEEEQHEEEKKEEHKSEFFATDKCNDERLKNIILEKVTSNPSESKRAIQKAATDEIGGLFDVVCSTHDFSYLANTQMFCEAGNDDVTCFAFLHSLVQ